MPPEGSDNVAPVVPTVRERLLAAGISPEKIADHFAAGAVRLDGELVTDLDQSAPPGTRPLFAGRG
jgi:hypothetical protein